jgi:glucosamine--fructose-6-phosphate aminotransferase (isomerizing)
MCGIIGYKGNKNAVEVCINGIKRLEYRGYDSWGVGYKENNEIKVIKKVGKIGKISLNDLNFTNCNIGIGHSRWATHGEVNEVNAHPHISMNHKIAVVHNGIVENYQELRDFLIKKGFSFYSQTDTEVIPNLIQYFSEKEKNNFIQATKKTLNKLQGSFAIIIINQDSDTIIGARRGSPLVLGLNKNEYFIASDVPAFLEYTNKVIYLDENEIVIINNDYNIFNLKNNKRIEKKIDIINWSLEQAQKGEYPHFMLKEIYEQKFTIKRAIEQDSVLIKKVTEMIKDAYGVFFVGCGTSYHACVSSAYVFSHVAKKHVNVVLASEFRNYEEFLTDKTLMIALSQSGETADLLDAVNSAKKKDVKIVSIVNVMGSSLTRLADENIMMNSGPEICVLSTKSYTSQLTILLLLAYSVAGRLEEGRELINKTSQYVPNVIENNIKKLKQLAKQTKDAHDFFLIGRDLAFPSALEGALKIKEVTYIHAEGFAGGELKHGTIALIEKNTPVIVLVTNETRSLILSNTMEVKSRGAFIIGLNSKENELFDYFIQIPHVSYANPILMIIPIQLLAYYLALERGCDPDKPRSLAKCVSVG